MDEKITPGQQNQTDFAQKALRTYEGDIAEAIQDHKTTQVSISIAETKRKQSEKNEEQNEKNRSSSIGKNGLLILLSIVLIGGGAFGAYYLYTLSPISAKPIDVQNIKSASLVRPDIQKVVDISNKDSDGIINSIKNQKNSVTLGQNGILELMFGQTNGSSSQNLSRIGGPEFITKIGLNAPDSFTRSLTYDWMFGFYNGDNGSEPFVILTTDFFQNAYAGLLKWEPVMADNLSSILNIQKVASQTTGTSSVDSYFTLRGHFDDNTIHNKDVRQFKDVNGDIQFMYTFIDNKTIVITKSVGALNEILRRIEQQTYVR
jgi:hypothetical protein